MAGLGRRLWGGLRASVRPSSSFYLSHSQFGEDMLVRALLHDKPKGFYVDLGAHHPIHYSNTYHFYCRGWRGLNVDAAPGSMKEFDRLRPRDINVEACLGASAREEVRYFLFQESALNTCDERAAERAVAHGARHLSTEAMSTITLQECLERHVPRAVQVDFLSIDIEGLDEQILLCHDWRHFSPRVIIFERHGLAASDMADLPVCRLLKPWGYTAVGKCGPSVVLCRGE